MTENQTLCYNAACPDCAADARWYASISHDGLESTAVTFEIDCVGCAEPEPAPVRPLPVYRPSVSSLSWLGRSA